MVYQGKIFCKLKGRAAAVPAKRERNGLIIKKYAVNCAEKIPRKSNFSRRKFFSGYCWTRGNSHPLIHWVFQLPL